MPFFAKEVGGVRGPPQHTEKAEPCPGKRPKKMKIHDGTNIYTLGEKEHFISTSVAA